MSKQGSCKLALAAGVVLAALIGFTSRTDAGTIYESLKFFNNDSRYHTMLLSAGSNDSTVAEIRAEIPRATAEYLSSKLGAIPTTTLPLQVLIGWIVLNADSVLSTGTAAPQILLHKWAGSKTVADTLTAKSALDTLYFSNTASRSLQIPIWVGYVPGAAMRASPGHFLRFRIKGTASTSLRGRISATAIWITP